MRALLINPPSCPVESDAESRNIGTVYMFPPLGLLYIAAYVNQVSRHTVEVIDLGTDRLEPRDLVRTLQRLRPAVIGLTVYTHTILGVLDTIITARSTLPDVVIVLGGPHVKAFPEVTLQIEGVLCAVRGEGELPFLEVLNRAELHEDLNGIPGVLTRNCAKDAFREPPFILKDLDSLPFPDRTLVSPRHYFSILARRNPVATVLTGRGCPFQCTFCDSPHEARVRSVDKVVEEISAVIGQGFREVFFYDETFNASERRVEEICEALDRRQIRVPWSFRGRADRCSRDLLARAKAAGCYRVQIGVETGTDEGLQLLNKGITTSEVIRAFRDAREVGLETVAYFMIGLPSERSPEDLNHNIEFLIELDPDYAAIALLECLPGTKLYQEGMEKGLFRDVWTEFARQPHAGFSIPHWTEFMSEEQLRRLHMDASRRFWSRPRYLLRTLTRNMFPPRGRVLWELAKRIVAGG